MNYNQHNPLRILSLFLIFILFPSTASANVGIPMLAFVWPGMWLLLIPVVVLEAFLAKRMLSLDRKDAWKVAGIVNTFSTAVGVPITWAILLLFEFVLQLTNLYEIGNLDLIINIPWLPPWAEKWMMTGSAAVQMIPFCLVSIWLERLAAQRILGRERKDEIRRWSWKANLISYGIIFSGLAIWTVVLIKK